jgi:predicted transcriptional regulator
MKLSRLSEKLRLHIQETSRHLSRLIEVKLVQKNADGLYYLTPFGEHVHMLLPGFEFLNNHREYFLTHKSFHLPEEFIGRIGELSKCEYVKDVMVVFQNLERMFREAEDYSFRITDSYLMLAVPVALQATQDGLNLKILTIKDIEYPQEFDEITAPYEKLMQEGHFIPRELEHIDIFLAMSEKEVAALSFPLKDGGFDYLGFKSKDKSALKWCRDLFEYYWTIAEPKRNLPWM